MNLATERLYRTADRRLVREGDPAATTLAYAVGDEMTDADAQAHAKVKPADEPAEPKPEPADDEPDTKAQSRLADKARRPAANK